MSKEILIAGSDITDQGEFQKVFETTDYHLIFSDKAEEALIRIKLFKPDLIIAGPALSGKGGLEFCEIIKLDPESKEIPVILVSGILEEITERDRMRVKADGVISKPLNEGEILNLVEGFMERRTSRLDKERPGERKEWASLQEAGGMAPGRNEGLFLDDTGEVTEEEIIELVDVVEEPEARMSIDDLVTAKQEGPYGEVSIRAVSEKGPGEEEKPYGELDFLTFDEKEIETKDEAIGPGVREKVAEEGKPAPLEQEASSEDDIFEKIDLEEILAKMERIQPSIEKEWPQERKVEQVSKPKPATPPQEEAPPEELFSIEEFESALKGGVKDETPAMDLNPISFEEPGAEASGEMTLQELSVEEEELTEGVEEEFPEEILEEMLEEEEIKAFEELKTEDLKEEEIVIEEPKAAPFDFFEERMEPSPQMAELGPEAAEPLRQEDRELFEAMESSKISEKIVSPMIKTVEKQLEEVIAKGVQDMIGDFIRKILPEMTQNIMSLTADRIEKMVREVVPELAEKAIQEEIKRIQKEAKD